MTRVVVGRVLELAADPVQVLKTVMRVIVFEFRSEATEEQKDDIRERIRNYPPVHQYLENVDTTPIRNEPPPVPDPTKEPVTMTR